jgi:hypothetical protein
MQRDAGVPSVVVSIVEAVIVLGLIVAWPLQSTRKTKIRGSESIAASAEV